MSLTAGELRHRITFQQLGTDRNLIGEVIQSWTDVATVWAKRVNKLSASAEAVASGAEGSRSVVQFDIRPLDVDAAWRIVFDAKVYNIRSVGTSNTNDRTSILATVAPEAST